MLSIRKYNDNDYDDVRYVCLNSDGDALKGTGGKFLLLTYCDYYIENEPENCFVLDDNGKAVGYILCTEDFDNFYEKFKAHYLPAILPLGENRHQWAINSVFLHKKYKDEYPSHLHVDLLPDYQRQGWGTKLMNALFEQLREKGVSGVMLTAGISNESGKNFYRKHGFTEMETHITDVAFGIKL